MYLKELSFAIKTLFFIYLSNVIWYQLINYTPWRMFNLRISQICEWFQTCMDDSHLHASLVNIKVAFKAPAAALHRHNYPHLSQTVQQNNAIYAAPSRAEELSRRLLLPSKPQILLQQPYLGAWCRCIGSSRWSSIAGVLEIIIIKSVHKPVAPEEGRPSCTPERIRVLVKVRPPSLIRISGNRRI